MSFHAEIPLSKDSVTLPLDSAVATRFFEEFGPSYGENLKTNFGVQQGALPDTLDLSPQIYPGSGDAALTNTDSIGILPTNQSEILVASLHEALPFEEERHAEQRLPPEFRLEAILKDLPSPSSPKFYDAITAAFEAMKEQYDLVQKTGNEYLDFPDQHNLEALIGKEHETALLSLTPKQQEDGAIGGKLDYLHYVVFSGQTKLEAEFKELLLRVSDDEGDKSLKAYFDRLDTVKAENPEMVNQFTETYQSYIRANERMVRMNDLFEASPLGQP